MRIVSREEVLKGLESLKPGQALYVGVLPSYLDAERQSHITPLGRLMYDKEELEGFEVYTKAQFVAPQLTYYL